MSNFLAALCTTDRCTVLASCLDLLVQVFDHPALNSHRSKMADSVVVAASVVASQVEICFIKRPETGLPTIAALKQPAWRAGWLHMQKQLSKRAIDNSELWQLPRFMCCRLGALLELPASSDPYSFKQTNRVDNMQSFSRRLATLYSEDDLATLSLAMTYVCITCGKFHMFRPTGDATLEDKEDKAISKQFKQCTAFV